MTPTDTGDTAWTDDLGVAVYQWQCLTETSGLLSSLSGRGSLVEIRPVHKMDKAALLSGLYRPDVLKPVIMSAVLLACACSRAAQSQPPTAADDPVGESSTSPTPRAVGVPAAEVHSEEVLPAASGATHEVRPLERLRAGLPDVPVGAVSSRVVLLDVVFPRSAAEFQELGGWTLILLTSLSHEASELPLKRAYVRSGSDVLDLPSAKVRASTVPEEFSDVAKVFGEHRSDELFFIPVSFTQMPVQVVVDFSRARTEFVVQSLPIPGSGEGIPEGVDLSADFGEPSTEAQLKFAQREFPFMFE